MSKINGIIDGICWCGCGEPTKPDKRGKLYRYIYGHQARGSNNSRYGAKLSEAQKQKIAEGNKGKQVGEKNGFFGQHHSEEQKQKWSKERKGRDAGENNPFYGKTHTEEVKELLRMKGAAQRAQTFTLPSMPEKAIHAELSKYSINFFTEVLIGNKFCVDVFIPQYNLIIYVDGCYWHACPEHCPKAKKPKTDNARIPYLSKCGYSVEIIWEHDIREDVEKVIKNICQKYSIKI